jgi:hypothetical protein
MTRVIGDANPRRQGRARFVPENRESSITIDEFT